MRVVGGFDSACAFAAMQAMKTGDETFMSRAAGVEFYGLHDPEPCGAVIFEGNVIHVASKKPCGLAVRRVVESALKTRDILFAPIAIDNCRARRLAVGLGFKLGFTSAGYDMYWRAS